MSQGVERSIAESQERKRRLGVLQGAFEGRGGAGKVEDFLVMGATDPQDGKERHWGTMTEAEQQLWLDLHKTGLTHTPSGKSLLKNPF